MIGQLRSLEGRKESAAASILNHISKNTSKLFISPGNKNVVAVFILTRFV